MVLKLTSISSAAPAYNAEEYDDCCICTYSGEKFSLTNPQPTNLKLEDVAHSLSILKLEDVAHSLAMQCRFTGHTVFHYSTAQHAWYASKLVATKGYPKQDARDMQRATLHHDDTESLIADINRPAKKLLPDYVDLEKRLKYTVAQRFWVPHLMPEYVRLIDDIMLVTEASQLLKKGNYKWWKQSQWPQPLDFKIRRWSPKKSKFMFMMRHYEVSDFNIFDEQEQIKIESHIKNVKLWWFLKSLLYKWYIFLEDRNFKQISRNMQRD